MSDFDFEVISPKELREEVLIQLLAVFVHRFGGEVTISAREFAMVEGAEILAHHITSDHLLLRLNEEEIILAEMDEDDLDIED